MYVLPQIKPGLLRHKLDEQTLVYDSRDDRIHLLDPITALVFDLLANRETPIDGIGGELSRRLDADTDPTIASLAIDRLAEAGLLQPFEHAGPDEISRRSLLRNAAIAASGALLIPLITTLTATPSYAQTTASAAACSLCTQTSQCTGGNTCIQGRCTVPPSEQGKPVGDACGNNNECCSNICAKTISSSPNKTCQPPA